jgi:hypothetical protein
VEKVTWEQKETQLFFLVRLHMRHTGPELAALRRSVVRGSPFGDRPWQERTARRLALEPEKKKKRGRSFFLLTAAGVRVYVMRRRPRHSPDGLVYHALNRAAARQPLFEKPADYDAFGP